MNIPAITISNVSKLYKLGETHSSIFGKLSAILKRKSAPLTDSNTANSFLALKDINLTIENGEVLGIIGRNGSGKSTLLKTISRITPPTTGTIEIAGRVSSLLEVGTGFHPELTGRENIFLNGAILGMSRDEISAKLSDIIDFSGVGKFIDTPVKRYSSGMYVRLAFSVASHLDPEILIVDEVLAVGDMAFQDRCMKKMNDVAKLSHTVLFVSHNMAAIETLCTRVAVLDHGEVQFMGEPKEATRYYFELMKTGKKAGSFAIEKPESSAFISNVSIHSASTQLIDDARFPSGEEITVNITCQFKESTYAPSVGIGIDDSSGVRVTSIHSKCDESTARIEQHQGALNYRCSISDLALRPGEYSLILALYSGLTELERVECALTFEIYDSNFFGNGMKVLPGYIQCKQNWDYEAK